MEEDIPEMDYEENIYPEEPEGIEVIKEPMALVATVVYDGVALMYEWMPVQEAKLKVKELLGRDEDEIRVN